MISNSASTPLGPTPKPGPVLTPAVPAPPFNAQVKPPPAPPCTSRESTEPGQAGCAGLSADTNALAQWPCGQPTQYNSAVSGGGPARRPRPSTRKAAYESAHEAVAVVTTQLQPRSSLNGVAGAEKVTSVPPVSLVEQVASVMLTALLAIAGFALAMLLAYVSSQAVVQRVSSPESSATQAEAAAARKEQQQSKAAERPARAP
jgi:hypothetical protein